MDFFDIFVLYMIVVALAGFCSGMVVGYILGKKDRTHS